MTGQPSFNFKHVKIFSDGADLDSMQKTLKNPLVKGFTTNPTLMRKAGISNYEQFAKEVLTHIKDLPISFEVFADDFPSMKKQALTIAKWGKNVNVKIPVTNSEGTPAYDLIQDLSKAGVKLNVTAVFTLEQVWNVAQALKGGPESILSVFAGRIADTGRDPMPLMTAASEICRAVDSNIQLLWASPREVLNIYQADQIGCDIITITPDLLGKLSNHMKDLVEFSRETVRMFYSDATKAGYSI